MIQLFENKPYSGFFMSRGSEFQRNSWLLRVAKEQEKKYLKIERTIPGLYSLTHIPLSLLSSEAMLCLFSRNVINSPRFSSMHFDLLMFSNILILKIM